VTFSTGSLGAKETKMNTDIQTIIHLLKGIAVVGAVIAMIYGIHLVFSRLKAKEQGFGPNSLKAIGVVLFVPSLVILAIVTDFKTETLAALLGTVAGYVLSNAEPNK
jgi:succinate dehydrogenase/fumarate reductase cytochrome b subunit